MPDASAVLTRYLDFPVAEVFVWCTDAKFLSQWLGPKGFETCEVESDLVEGYWIWELSSIDDALAWVKRCPNPMSVPSEIEMRPIGSCPLQASVK